MIIISYDIKDDKLRSRFAKYIKRFGYRLQYSVYAIDNSDKIIDNITNDICNKFEPCFDQHDSVIIIKTTPSCEIIKMGYAQNEDKDLIII